jgi:hypothetical protein
MLHCSNVMYHYECYVDEVRPASPVQSMMAQIPQYRVIVQAQHHPHRGYAYVILRVDLPEWAESSPALYATLEAAAEAGWMALERFIHGGSV